VVTAENHHQVGIELPDPVRCHVQRSSEAAPEGVLHIAFLAWAVARADHQPF